jgi:hypothetical protein
VSTYVIELSDGRTAEVDGDEIRTIDGALMIGRAPAPPPAPLRIIAVFAPRQWLLCHPADAPVTFGEPAPGAQPPPRARKGPQILPAVHIDDPLR